MIVGFGHVARVGKDEAAAALVDALGYRRIAFADALRDHALRVDPIVDRWTDTRLSQVIRMEGWEKAKDKLPEVRRILEAEGQACRDTFGMSCWIHAAGRTFGAHEDIAIPDVRYMNEVAWIRSLGGIVVRIDRPGYTPRGPSDRQLSDFTGWDHVITNDGSLEHLRQSAIHIARRIHTLAGVLPQNGRP